MIGINLINVLFTAIFLLSAAYLWYLTVKLKNKKGQPEEGLDGSSGSVLIAISVPKNNEKSPLAAEQFFAAMHGIFRDGATKQSSISCEIVSKNKLINFYLSVPAELKDFVLSQVYAQYPNVDVKILPQDQDYAQTDQVKSIAATELGLKKPTVYPLKTFVNFEVDPLATITGVLSSTSALEEIWTQVIISPIADDWQDLGDEEIKKVKEPPKKATGVAELLLNEVKAFVVQFTKSVVTGNGIEEAKKEEKKDDKKELSGPVQQAIKGIEEKITKLGFNTTIRILVAAPDQYAAQAKLEQVIGAYKQFNTNNLNAFVSKAISNSSEAVELYRSRAIGDTDMIFNITELATIYHFPSETVSTPTIAWSGAKKGEPPSNLPMVGTVPDDQLTVFAKTNFRNEEIKFGIKRDDRRLHTYIIGKTGTGKSTLMENMIYDDIQAGRGLAVVDPHGELIEHVLDLIPESRVKDVVYFNPADYDYPVGFNVLESVSPEFNNIIASGVVGIFKKIFGESWGPRLEYILRNAILALLEYPNSTLLGVMRILSDNGYRRSVLSTIKDPVVKDFFVNEFEKYEPKFRQEAIAPIQNKVGQFTSSSTIRNIIGQPKSAMNIREIMDSGKILLANLSTGKIGEDNSALLGAMLITKVQLAAMGRTDMLEADRKDFYLYVDEFQNFATDSFATILSEARKYRLNLVMINQYISQMPETVADAVFGNVGTMIAFRVGSSDAEALKNEFQPVFDVNDLVNQPNRQIYLKMAIDGVTVPAFSAGTLPPPAEKHNLHAEVVQASRDAYATARTDVEEYIADWSEPVNLSESWQQGSDITQKPRIKDHGFAVAPTTAAVSTAQKNIEATIAEVEAGETPVESPAKLQKEADALEGLKVEMVNDRFNRKWYAVSGAKKSSERGSGEIKNQISDVKDQNNSSSTQQPEDKNIEQGSGPEIHEPVVQKAEPMAVPSVPAIANSQPMSELPATDFVKVGEREPGKVAVGEILISDTKPLVEIGEISAGSSETHIEEKELPASDQSGGVGEQIEEKNVLITWEDVDKLGLQIPKSVIERPSSNTENLEPIDEL